MAEDPGLDLNNNAGRKYRDLQKRCATGPVVVWLVTEGNAGLRARNSSRP